MCAPSRLDGTCPRPARRAACSGPASPRARCRPSGTMVQRRRGDVAVIPLLLHLRVRDLADPRERPVPGDAIASCVPAPSSGLSRLSISRPAGRRSTSTVGYERAPSGWPESTTTTRSPWRIELRSASVPSRRKTRLSIEKPAAIAGGACNGAPARDSRTPYRSARQVLEHQAPLPDGCAFDDDAPVVHRLAV